MLHAECMFVMWQRWGQRGIAGRATSAWEVGVPQVMCTNTVTVAGVGKVCGCFRWDSSFTSVFLRKGNTGGHAEALQNLFQG